MPRARSRKQPGFSATVVLTLGLGIAVNAVVFTIVNAAVLRPLPFENAERVVRLGLTNVGMQETPQTFYLDFQE